MNDRAALEVALAANPDDFATHAAYADLLTEQGDPRGDYIRLQLALEDRHQPVERLRAMEQEAFELRQRHEAEWLGPLYAHTTMTAGGLRNDVNMDVLEENVQVTYRRGWLHSARVRTLTPDVTAAFRDCPVADLLADLDVSTDALAEVATLPVANLIRLRFNEVVSFELAEIGDADTPAAPPAGWFHPVAAVPRFPTPRDLPRLRDLLVHSPSLGDRGLEAMASSGLLDQLRGLDLSGCGITDDGAQLLAAHPAVAKLDYLHLDDNHISPIGIDALAAVGVVISQRQHLGPLSGDDTEPADGEIAF